MGFSKKNSDYFDYLVNKFININKQSEFGNEKRILDNNSKEVVSDIFHPSPFKWLKSFFGKKDPSYEQTEFFSSMHKEATVCTRIFVILSVIAIAILGVLVYGYLNTGIKIEEAKELYKFIPYVPITIACYIAFAVLCRYALVYSRLSLQYRHKARLIELTRLPNINQNIKDSIYRELIAIDIPDPKKHNDLNDIVDVMIKLKELNK